MFRAFLLIGIVIITLFSLLFVFGVIAYSYYKDGNTNANSNSANAQEIVSPLHIVEACKDKYSVKLTNRETGLVNIYSGTFFYDFQTRIISLQRVFMEMIETTIQQMVEPNFNIGLFPDLGKPYGVTFKPKDILVSFTDRRDYLIFGEDLSVTFYSVEAPIEIYNYSLDGANFNFISSYHDISYSGTYNTYGEFIININDGNNISFDSSVMMYNSSTMTPTNLSNGTVLYKNSEIGITVLPNVLPSNIKVAGYVSGIFSSPSNPVSYQEFEDYITGKHSFSTSQKKSLIPILKDLYFPIEYSLRYGLELKDHYSYTNNNGFATASFGKKVILEIRLT